MSRGFQKTVFFDRDNTIIVDHVYLNDPDKIEYLPGASECLKKLYELGYAIVIVTNQSGVPRGLVQLENLEEIHRRIAEHFRKDGIEIAGFYYAPHLPESDHPLRKPNPGMLLKAAEDHCIDLKSSWMVGDRKTDVVAGYRAGTRSIFLMGTEDLEFNEENKPEFVAENLYQVADYIEQDFLK